MQTWLRVVEVADVGAQLWRRRIPITPRDIHHRLEVEEFKLWDRVYGS